MNEIASGLGGITSAFFEQPDDVCDALRAYGASLFAPLVAKLGWVAPGGEATAPGGYQTSMLRQLAVSRALAYEHPASVAAARELFDAYVGGDREAIPADIKGAVFASALRHGGERELDELKRLYKEAESSLEESLLLGAMGASKDPALISRVLEFNMTDAVRKQDGAAIIGASAGTRAGRRVTWDWVRANWDAVDAKFGGGGVSSGLTRVIGASCGGLASGAFYTLVPIRPCWRGERRSLRTFAVVSLRPGSLAFNPRARCLSTPTDAYELHPDIPSYGMALRGGRGGDRGVLPPEEDRRRGADGDAGRGGGARE